MSWAMILKSQTTNFRMGTNTCVFILGPTASGKTSVAIDLAEHFSTAVISADSRQIYRGMDIGVAKPTPGISKNRQVA